MKNWIHTLGISSGSKIIEYLTTPTCTDHATTTFIEVAIGSIKLKIFKLPVVRRSELEDLNSTEENYVEIDEKLLEANDIEKSLEFHFCYLCYPPVPLYMIPTAVNALEKVVSGDGCFSIDLPCGVTWRRESSVRAIHVVESLYLQAFIDFLEERDPRVNTDFSNSYETAY